MRAVDMDEFVPLDTRLRHPPEMFGFAKLVSFVLLATAPIALSTPVPAELAAAIDTSSHCGQYDAVNVGPYTLYLDQWGLGSGVTGSDCASLTSLSGTTIAWKAVWTFNTASGGIKSFTNINVNTGLNKALSAIKTMPSTWKWSQSTSSVVADVAYDLFTANNAGGANVNEIMIWLANFNAGPISASYNAQGQPVAVATNLSIAGHTWNLYFGSNGSNNVYSFLPTSGTITSFSGDLNLFFKYLTANRGLSTSQVLVTAQGGTEATSGSATLTTSAFSLVVN
ncbi:unnamed protein product [Mycena citricolor]|uniref:Glycoside hydrolase family 12 protein n=1 Tax=Mycena citricolor TaxID=2018698 RepID=A0AAD2GQR5_9AGAR|nr:unnamed protein product [Mycena citricolor]